MQLKRNAIAGMVLSAGLLMLQLPAAEANSMTYTAPTPSQPGRFSGELPINRIGTVALPDGLVKFTDDEISVEAVPDWLFDREAVLHGVIVRAEVAAQQNTSVVAGLAFFLDGNWLTNLGPRRVPDQVLTTAGETVSGRITGRVGQAFAIQLEQGGTRKIDFSEIKSITSPRAFSFNIPTPTARLSPTDTSLSFESNLITMAPSSNRPRFESRAKVPQSNLPGADPGISNSTIGTFVALDVISEIAPAVSIPLVLSRYTQAHALKQISDSLHAQLGLPPN